MQFRARFKSVEKTIVARLASEEERARRRRVNELAALIDSDPETARVADEFAEKMAVFTPPPDRPGMTWQEAANEGELGDLARRLGERLEMLEARTAKTPCSR